MYDTLDLNNIFFFFTFKVNMLSQKLAAGVSWVYNPNVFTDLAIV